ncbi:MAG: T9SS type A sorting domain-containing protein [Bacteroidetes bacterium]|nr:T9SS type A sorting domain-containing protein [Bacteroidota bacterium]MBU1114503.1 T9SS type A sorting domain-containing protein [Bacteroidota bacterium]MBU1797867.1 T9SS type A sorting domain-containing protein [Bacteroidota bacterium]
MKTVPIFLLFLIFSFQLLAQTTNTFNETFKTNNELGWAFLASDASISTQNGELKITSYNDDFIYILPPIEATIDDFSIKIKAGSGQTNIEAGGIGRSGFKSLISLLISDPLYGDSITVVYTDDIQSYDEPNFTVLTKYPIPDNVSSLKLDVSRSGANLNISASVNDNNFYNGSIANADPSLFSGNMIIMLDPIDETNLVEWTLDEIEIKYNPLIETPGYFYDDFNDPNSPWFRFGDFDNIANSVNILDGNLNFNYNGNDETALFVIAPVGAVKDFTIELEGNATLNHNSPFGISRFYDYKNYVTMYIEEDTIYLGYASNSYEPTMITSGQFSATGGAKIKFSVEGNSPNLSLKAWVNDVLIASGNITDATPKLETGLISFGYERGNIVEANIFDVTINYESFIKGEAIFLDHLTERMRLSMFNNSLVGHNSDVSLGYGLNYLSVEDDYLYTGGLIFGNQQKGISGMLGSFSISDLTADDKIVFEDPSSYFDQKIVAKYSDVNYVDKYGVQITQESYSEQNKDMVFINYKLKNVSGNSLNDFYIGMFADFDIIDAYTNLGGYDANRKLIYQYSPQSSIEFYFGIVALSGTALGKVTNEEGSRSILFDLMKNTDWTTPTVAGDYRTYISSGPFNISNMGEENVTFALIAASNYNDLLIAADEAKNIYDSQFVGVENERETRPTEFALYQNYPNPFNPSTIIKYQLPAKNHVSIKIYDILGNEIADLVDEIKAGGIHEVEFNASGLSSGIYFYKLSVGNFLSVNKLVLIK